MKLVAFVLPFGRSCKSLLPLLLLSALPVVVQAQSYTDNYGTWTYTTANGAITITAYTGPGGDVTIPDRIPDTTNGLPVTSIGELAFATCTSLTSVTIPNSVTSIGDIAFLQCSNLASVTIAEGVTSIGREAFGYCSDLASVTIPDSVNSIGDSAFSSCGSLASVTIPNSVTSVGKDAFRSCSSLVSVTIGNSGTSVGNYAFSDCTSLTGVYFQGNAPTWDCSVFAWNFNATAYYLPGTTGWDTFNCIPTALWFLPNPLILSSPSFGVGANGFSFIISWATNTSVVVEACTDFANPIWFPVSTNTLTDGWSYFSDPQWRNYARRFYRVRSP